MLYATSEALRTFVKGSLYLTNSDKGSTSRELARTAKQVSAYLSSSLFSCVPAEPGLPPSSISSHPAKLYHFKQRLYLSTLSSTWTFQHLPLQLTTLTNWSQPTRNGCTHRLRRISLTSNSLFDSSRTSKYDPTEVRQTRTLTSTTADPYMPTHLYMLLLYIKY